MITEKVLSQSTVFEHNKDFDAHYFRIPFMGVTKKGTLIAGGDIRYVDSSDYNHIDIGIARSEDGGLTWIDKQIVHKRRGIHPEHSRKMDGCILVDQVTGRIFIFAVAIDVHMHLDSEDHKMQDLVYVYSDDDGKTWSQEISLKKFYDEGCNLFFQGPGNGIQLEDGTLVIPIQRWVPPHTHIRAQAGIIYSKDHGETWHRSETLIDTYSSESSVVEYRPNEILISSRTPLTDARGFYTTKDLGKTWVTHESNNTIYERGGCQSPILKFIAPNQKTYGVYVAPQHNGICWERSKLTLFATDDFINWNTITEVLHLSNDGYSSLTYDENKQALYLLTEQKGDLVCHNLSLYLPVIMTNHKTYDHQALSKSSRFPAYTMGHYMKTSHKDHWYKLLTLKLKPNSFALLSLHVLGFHHDATITLRAKEQSPDCYCTENIELISSLPLKLIPTVKEDDYFVYELYYQATTPDTLSLAVQNCMLSDFDQAKLQISTSFQDHTLETSFEVLPHSN